MKKLLLSCILLISGISSFGQTTCANATNITTNGTKSCPAITGTYSNPCYGGTLDQDGGGTLPLKAIWYKYTPASNGVMTVSSDLAVNDGVTNSDDTRLSIFTGTCAALQCLDANDDIAYIADGDPGNNLLSTLTLNVAAGTTYYIQWDNNWSAKKFSFTFTFTAVACLTPESKDFYLPGSYTTTSANLYWTPTIGDPANYDVDWSTDFNAAAGAGTNVSVSAGALTYVQGSLTGLPESSNFRYYVRSNCGGSTSDYQGPFYGYLAKKLPYSNDFEDAGKNYKDGFIGFITYNSGDYTAPLDTYADGGAGSAVLTYNDTTAESDLWGYSRALSLTAGETVTVNFKTRLYSATTASPMAIALTVGNDQTSTAQTTAVSSFTITDASAYSQQTASWTAPADGVYYFGFHNNSPIGTDDTYLFLDTLEFTSVLSVNDFVSSKFSISPNPTKDLISVSSEKSLISDINITDLNGRIVMQKTFNKVSRAQMNISELATGMYMMSVKSDAGSFTKKIVKE